MLANIFKPESENVEYKEKLTDSLEKEAVALLNANGGCIYIGVKDNGDIVGVPNIDKIQLQIKDRLITDIQRVLDINPELMRILKDLELVEALGFGIRGITRVYNQDIFEFAENSLYIPLPFDESREIVRGKSKGKK